MSLLVNLWVCTVTAPGFSKHVPTMATWGEFGTLGGYQALSFSLDVVLTSKTSLTPIPGERGKWEGAELWPKKNILQTHVYIFIIKEGIIMGTNKLIL